MAHRKCSQLGEGSQNLIMRPIINGYNKQPPNILKLDRTLILPLIMINADFFNKTLI